MAETIWIDFAPDEWRYYYDAVRLFGEGGETLLVPIHAYPVMNRVTLPKRLDFGSCALLDEVVKSVELACEVPVAFEYEVVVVVTHPQFELLSPTRGVVGPHGVVKLAVRRRRGRNERTLFRGARALSKKKMPPREPRRSATGP